MHARVAGERTERFCGEALGEGEEECSLPPLPAPLAEEVGLVGVEKPPPPPPPPTAMPPRALLVVDLRLARLSRRPAALSSSLVSMVALAWGLSTPHCARRVQAVASRQHASGLSRPGGVL